MARDRGLAQWVIYTSTWVHNHRTQSINWSINQSLIPGSSIDLGTSQSSLAKQTSDVQAPWKTLWILSGAEGEWERAMREPKMFNSHCVSGQNCQRIFLKMERDWGRYSALISGLCIHMHTQEHIYEHINRNIKKEEEEEEKLCGKAFWS